MRHLRPSKRVGATALARGGDSQSFQSPGQTRDTLTVSALAIRKMVVSSLQSRHEDRVLISSEPSHPASPRRSRGHFWVFGAALTNVEYAVEVIDTQTGAVWTHHNAQGTLASYADTTAF